MSTRLAPGVAAAGALVLLAALLVLVGRPLATDDTWWHLALGSVYATQGPWADTEPLLHTSGARSPVPHEWLFQVSLHGVEWLFGLHGLRVLHVLLVAGSVVLTFRLARRSSGEVAAAALATGTVMAVSWFRLFQLRPELVSFPALLALHALLLADEEGPRPAQLALGALLLVFLANAHSLFAIGLALLLAAVLGTLLFRALARAVPDARGSPAWTRNALRGRRLAVALALGALVTLANPRGIEQHLTFFVEARVGSIWQIQDDFLPWNPLRPAMDGAAFPLLSWLLMDGLLFAFAASALRGCRRLARERSAAALVALDPVGLSVAAAALVACLVAVRFHWLAVFPLLYLLGRHGSALGHWAGGWVAATASVTLAVATPLFGGWGAFAAEVAREPGGYWDAAWMERRYCASGMRFLRDTRVAGRLYNPFNLGGVLGYWLSPRLRTFIDGRLDHVPHHVLEDYLAVRRASLSGPGAELMRLLDAWRVDFFFADAFPELEYEKRLSGIHLRRLDAWLLVHASDTHAIYARRHPRNRRNLQRIAAYYRERGISFDVRRGLDLVQVVREAPDWARAQGLEPPDREQLDAWLESDDAATRAAAHERLAAHYWRVGRFAAQLPHDRFVIAAAPTAYEPRRRFVDALLQLGRLDEGLEAARELHALRPESLEAAHFLAVAESAAAARESR